MPWMFGWGRALAMMPWSFGWGGALMMFFGWLLPLAVVALIIWLVIGVRGKRQGDATVAEDTALRIARERYARGEISREEFQQLLADLRKG
jgi:putative membrane protein